MKTSIWVIIVVIIIILAGGAWWYYSQGGTNPMGAAGINGSPNQGNLGGTATGTPEQPGSTSGDGTGVSQNLILGITAGSGDIANYLSAYNGMTVYTYAPDSDTPGQSSCTGSCATSWPPYTVASASDINVSAATTGTVGTITRADGSLQVTYNGMPLYFYSKDTAPGQANGEGVGGVWYVVHP